MQPEGQPPFPGAIPFHMVVVVCRRRDLPDAPPIVISRIDWPQYAGASPFPPPQFVPPDAFEQQGDVWPSEPILLLPPGDVQESTQFDAQRPDLIGWEDVEHHQ